MECSQCPGLAHVPTSPLVPMGKEMECSDAPVLGPVHIHGSRAESVPCNPHGWPWIFTEWWMGAEQTCLSLRISPTLSQTEKSPQTMVNQCSVQIQS